jgi:hypothetical protein
VIPSDLYAATLSALTQARSIMLSPEWQAALDAANAANRLAASHELIQVQQAILAVSNAVLGEIADKMAANEQGLTQATSALTAALGDITKVQNVLQAITGLVNAVAKILPLL